MKPFSYFGEMLGGRPKLFCEPRCCQSISSAGPSSSSTSTGTTSGPGSPVSAAGSQAVGTGSIGVAGTGAKYLEEGAADNEHANQSTNITASKGSTVTIGDPNAGQEISSLASQFAQTVQGVAGSGGSPIILGGTSTGATGTSTGISLQTILFWGGIAAVILFLANWLFKRGKS
jgi:hypothetical protein